MATTSEMSKSTNMPSSSDQMRAITISREYGSGGGEVARRLATKLDWHLVDHEVVVQVAQALGISVADAEAHDEHADTFASRILNSLGILPSSIPTSMPVQLASDQPAYDEARRRVVEGAVTAGHSIIVGRGAQALLADRKDVLHVRIVAPLEQRITYVMRREGLSRAAAQERISAKDRERHRFLQAVHHKDPSDTKLYDIVVNSGLLDLDSIVELLVLALSRKAKSLEVPAEALGPGAGMKPYEEAPGDIAPLS